MNEVENIGQGRVGKSTKLGAKVQWSVDNMKKRDLVKSAIIYE